MKTVQAIGLSNLPRSVLDALVKLGIEFRAKGAVLRLFGSFAEGKARANSDLDIACQWESPPNPKLEADLYQAVDSLPTIRPVDLVDLRFASDALRRRVVKVSVRLDQLKQTAR